MNLRVVQHHLGLHGRRLRLPPCSSLQQLFLSSYYTTTITIPFHHNKKGDINFWRYNNNSSKRFLSSSGWTGVRGHDITSESLDWGDRPKVVIQSYAPTGFDVQNTVKKVANDEISDGVVHMNGSIIVFPFGCFLWNIENVNNITIDSLAPILLHRPKIEYLFIGVNKHGKNNIRIPLQQMKNIQEHFKPHGIVVEQMNLSNAIGTFNILNAEDRQVAAALIIDRTDTDSAL